MARHRKRKHPCRYGVNKNTGACLKNRRPSARRKGGYRKGRRPFNKGKKCVSMGRGRNGKPVCRSYGGSRRNGKTLRLSANAGPSHNAPLFYAGSLPYGMEGFMSRGRRRRRRR